MRVTATRAAQIQRRRALYTLLGKSRIWGDTASDVLLLALFTLLLVSTLFPGIQHSAAFNFLFNAGVWGIVCCSCVCLLSSVLRAVLLYHLHEQRARRHCS